MNVADASELAGLEAWEFVRRLLVEERISVDIIGFAMREENVSMFLSAPSWYAGFRRKRIFAIWKTW